MKILSSNQCWIFIFLLPLWFGCNSVRYLKGDESYLVKNKIEFDKQSSGKIKNKSNLEYELTTLYKQKPNSNFLGVPRQYFHYSAMDTILKSKFGKKWNDFLRKNIAEEPVFFDEETAQKTAETMKYYLQHKGYFLADVRYFSTPKSKGRKTEVTYEVFSGGEYTIDTLIYLSQDKKLEKILRDRSEASFLKKEKPVSVQLYNQEVGRITTHLRNNGYAYFAQHYISGLESLDSSNFKVKLRMKIFPPKGDSLHQVYKVGTVFIYPHFNPAVPASMQIDTVIQGVYFSRGGDHFRVKPKTLMNSINIKKGDLFSEQNVINTNRQLNSLGVFRFVSVRYEEDSLQQDRLNFFIELTPNKKWEFGANFDINTTARKGGTVGNRNQVGLSVSPSLRSRNLFRGAELLVSNIDFGVELAPRQKPILNTLDIKVQGDLYFPRFVDYFKFWKGMEKVGLLSDKYYQRLKGRATSQLSSSYNLLALLDFYTLHLVNVSFGYDLPHTSKSRFIINNFGIEYFYPTNIRNSFQTILDNNPFLANSFKTQLITSFLLREFTYIYSELPVRNRTAWHFQGTADFSGTEIWAANKLRNKIVGNESVFDISGVEFSQYARFEIELRRYWKLNRTRTFILRLNSGVVFPFGFAEEVPYVKQFYVGGLQSIRGWYSRGLGPGGFVDPITFDPSERNSFYQTGNFKLEWNAEYRFFAFRPLNLFDFNAALFVDGGNVWTLNYDEERKGSQLQWRTKTLESGEQVGDNFFKQMAVSAGLGVRWDFTYFIFRLDLGTPIRNNYPDTLRNDSYWVDFSKWQFKNSVVWHLALGYPF